MKLNTLRLIIRAVKTLLAGLENEIRENINDKSKDKEIEHVDQNSD